MDLKFLILILNTSKFCLSFTWDVRLFHNKLPQKAKELTPKRVDLAGDRSSKSPLGKL